MSLDSVRAFFAETAPDIAVLELETRTATVAEAAAATGSPRHRSPRRSP